MQKSSDNNNLNQIIITNIITKYIIITSKNKTQMVRFNLLIAMDLRLTDS